MKQMESLTLSETKIVEPTGLTEQPTIDDTGNNRRTPTSPEESLVRTPTAFNQEKLGFCLYRFRLPVRCILYKLIDLCEAGHAIVARANRSFISQT
jgi:hypothetical protein